MSLLTSLESSIFSAHQRGAASELLQLADAAEALQSPDAAALAHLARGMSAVHADDYPRALECLEAALSAFDKHGNRHNAAHALLNIGVVRERVAEYDEALVHYHRALAIAQEENDAVLKSACTTNIGIVYAKSGDLPSALEYLQRSLASDEERGDRAGAADVIGNIGIVYQQTGDYPSALDAYRKAVAIHEEFGNSRAAAMTIGNIGIIYQSTGEYETALEYFSQALTLHHEHGNRASIARVTGNMGIVHANMGNYETAIECGKRSMELHAEIGNREGHGKAAANVIDAFVSNGQLQEARSLLELVESTAVDNPHVDVRILSVKGYLLQQEGLLDESHEVIQTALRIAHELGLRPLQADLHQALRDLAQRRNDFAGYIEHNNEYARITEEIKGKEATTKLAMQESQRKLETQEREHAKHLAVLHSTLPKHVAERVARGEVVNDTFDNAAVIFLDIVGFTELSSQLSSQEVIELLDDVFTQCDVICAQRNVTKIKTIGDSYMCVSFESNTNAALCALDFLHIRVARPSVAHQRRALASHEVLDAPHEVEFRIGIHCGPVSAGVIGKERMQYDVWGDTVNVASRMESSGSPGCIHVSQAFAANLEEESRIKNLESNHEIKQYRMVERGKIEIKGKGLMKTFWLES